MLHVCELLNLTEVEYVQCYQISPGISHFMVPKCLKGLHWGAVTLMNTDVGFDEVTSHQQMHGFLRFMLAKVPVEGRYFRTA